MTAATRTLNARTFDAVFGVEPRGFILGSDIAHACGKGFVPIRKKGKLPATTITIPSVDSEAQDSEFEIHADALVPGQTVLLVDGNPYAELRVRSIAAALEAAGVRVLVQR